MIEVVIRLRFITPCLGNVRNKDAPDAMLKDTEGRILFLPAWWSPFMAYGAKAFSKHQKLVHKIRWDPVVSGADLGIFRRYYNSTDYKEHEAFMPGTEIEVRAMLPSGLELEDCKSIVDIAGRFQGFSPYGHGDRYGHLEVVSIDPTHRGRT